MCALCRHGDFFLPGIGGSENTRSFVQSLFILVLRHGVCDDARPRVKGNRGTLTDSGADDDIELAFAIESEVSDGSGIEPSGMALQFGNDLERSLLRGTADRSAGKAGLESRRVIDLRT